MRCLKSHTGEASPLRARAFAAPVPAGGRDQLMRKGGQTGSPSARLAQGTGYSGAEESQAEGPSFSGGCGAGDNQNKSRTAPWPTAMRAEAGPLGDKDGQEPERTLQDWVLPRCVGPIRLRRGGGGGRERFHGLMAAGLLLPVKCSSCWSQPVKLTALRFPPSPSGHYSPASSSASPSPSQGAVRWGLFPCRPLLAEHPMWGE